MDPVAVRQGLRAIAHAARDRARQDGRLDRTSRARHQQPPRGIRIREFALVQSVHSTEFLNAMLESERAGAKALVVFMDDFPRGSPEWKILRKVHEEEAHNCGQIGELLKKAGADYSHATGGVHAEGDAVKSAEEKAALLIKRRRWG